MGVSALSNIQLDFNKREKEFSRLLLVDINDI